MGHDHALDFHVYFGREALTARAVLRKLSPRDCFAALAEGFDHFRAMPSHVAFLGAIYALGGIAIASMGSFANALELVFPFAAGFALVGPFLAVSLYEMSRRRQMGRAVDWRDAFAALRSPALPAIAALGLVLFVIFAWWIVAAEAIYVWLYGPQAPASAAAFFADVLTTGRGWTLIVVGDLVGFAFAATALCLSVVSFPLLLDRDVGLVAAVSTSLRLARENPQAVAYGADRRDVAGDWLGAAVRRAGGRAADPRTRDMAALPARRRARAGARAAGRMAA